ncbi:putative hydrolase of the HAD superfamily [Catenibacillus scindens]|uniref:Putative hydrolase of the HAD superfamily n=1 Tax=Catenibacillus scindens TaxID=673271 RepID=A0A7W8M4D6_9FIRM|nr:HAD family hydrolase [Catenibacillus scindens]MBB5263497.1 putative hydrolase of the HAD superfamily [Catenibacillus scindens]
MKIYKNCIFDLYGTLVDIHTDEGQSLVWEKLALFYGYYGAHYSPLELKGAYERMSRQDAASHAVEGMVERNIGHEAFPEIQIEKVFAGLFRMKGVEADPELSVLAGQFFRVLSTEYVRLYDGAAGLLKNLRDRGRKVILLSNAQRIFTEYEMKALGIWDLFDRIFISSDYGVKKPDIRFYKKMMEVCRIAPEESIMVGNDGICDIHGAKAAGLSTLYLRSNLSPKEDIPDADWVVDPLDMGTVQCILLEGTSD